MQPQIRATGFSLIADRTYWVASRVAAACVGAVVVGLGAAVLIAAVGVLTCGHDTPCDFWLFLRYKLYVKPIVSALLGIVPGILVLTLTPAKKYPWRTLPALVLATLGGFVVWAFVLVTLQPPVDLFWLGLSLLLVPSLAGFGVALNIDRLPPLFRLFASVA